MMGAFGSRRTQHASNSAKSKTTIISDSTVGIVAFVPELVRERGDKSWQTTGLILQSVSQDIA
ncbi:MAG: hypothetical protein CL608_24240 [Anaerolineaceae bacterium]|nr:hypothetical protein [Anaerolineaceae bacterium]